MNRKNTILIAVMINTGLLAVLLVAALTTQPELPLQNEIAKEIPSALPRFDDAPLYQELPVLTFAEGSKHSENTSFSEPLLHQLPPLVPDTASLPQAPVAASIVKAAPVPFAASTTPINEIAVKKGDSLEKIAKAHRTSVDEIIKLNRLSNTFLKIGQVLKIPTERSLPVAVQEKKPAELGPEYYTIKVGENPWAIAIRHHMKLDELLKLNGLNEEKARKLKPGDRLRIR